MSDFNKGPLTIYALDTDGENLGEVEVEIETFDGTAFVVLDRGESIELRDWLTFQIEDTA